MPTAAVCWMTASQRSPAPLASAARSSAPNAPDSSSALRKGPTRHASPRAPSGWQAKNAIAVHAAARTSGARENPGPPASASASSERTTPPPAAPTAMRAHASCAASVASVAATQWHARPRSTAAPSDRIRQSRPSLPSSSTCAGATSSGSPRQ